MIRRLALLLCCLSLFLPGLVASAPTAVAAGDDTVLAFGDAPFAGSTSGMQLAQPLVAMATTRAGDGYWLLARDGGLFAFGNAAFHGSTGGIRLNLPVVGMAPTASGSGYWMVAEDGGIFAFGDAEFLGSMGGTRLNRPIVAMAATPTGRGYWLVASDGGMFTFGDASFFGSTGGTRLHMPIVAMAAAPNAGGYWLLSGDGTVFAFGGAPHLGNAPGHAPVVSIAATPTGNGYRILDRDGGVFTFGDASFEGSASGAIAQPRRALAIASTPTGRGYWVVAAQPPVSPIGPAAASTRNLQARLDALGYWVPVDGRGGTLTTQALYAIEKSAGIPRTGRLDAATARALDAGFVPRPRSTAGYVAEVDKSRQIIMLVSNGRVVRVFNTSTGNGRPYQASTGRAIAITPEGNFKVERQINGLRISDLGELFRPKYFTGGYAIHGSPSIPPFPASHGCVRVSNAAINFLWDSGSLPIGTPVLVYS